MLKQRLITAAVLIPLFVWAVLVAPLPQFALLLGLFVIQGAWEWTGLMAVHNRLARLAYCILVAAGLGLVWLYAADLIQAVLFLGSLWWLLAIPLVLGYPATTKLWRPIPLQAVIGFVVLVPAWAALVYLKIHQAADGYWLLLLFILIWAADSGAYFSGRRWGKHKLAPRVSPGKTWEGVVGGLVIAIGMTVAALYMGQDSQNLNWPVLFLLLTVTVFFSVLGDLFESMFKRHVGVKDSGRLLPGHGGVLDRIDSATAAAPVFAFGLSLMADLTPFPSL